MNISKVLVLFVAMVLQSLIGTGQDWNIVWQDEFNGSIGGDWVFETGRGGNGWGNNELQFYRRENTSVENGSLVITAKRQSFNGANYTSARMKTQGRKRFKFGRIEARIALPSGNGLWPAFWMLGSNITSVGWPACGEIDIMERVNEAPEIHGTFHWSDSNNNYATFGRQTVIGDAGQWQMVPGLAGTGISFRSVNFPNRYLRHRNSEVWLDSYQNNNQYKADASFFQRPGLSNGSQASFESVNFPGRFLRHRGSLLFVENVPNANSRSDATFFFGGGIPTSDSSQQIEAENYVDSNNIQKEPCSEGGQNVGYIQDGSWMAYQNVNFPSSGAYRIEYRVASAVNGGRLSADLSAGSVRLGELPIPNIGGWQSWRTITQNVNVNAGTYPFGLYAVIGSWNINWIRITKVNNANKQAGDTIAIVS